MIEWVDNKKIYVHIDKHVIGNKVESSKWKNMYYVKNYGNYDEIVREYENGSKEELSNYYVNSSHDVINNSESEYLYLDTFGNTSLNFKRKAEDSDLTTCTQVFDRRLKIVSCFFKDDLIKHFDIFFLIKNLHFDYKGELYYDMSKLYYCKRDIDNIIMHAEILSNIGNKLIREDVRITNLQAYIIKLYFENYIKYARRKQYDSRLYEVLVDIFNKYLGLELRYVNKNNINNYINYINRQYRKLIVIKKEYSKYYEEIKIEYLLKEELLNISNCFLKKEKLVDDDNTYWNELFKKFYTYYENV